MSGPVRRLCGSALTHTFVELAVSRLGLDSTSFVVEVASNDGYLLQHSVARGIRSLGIEPAGNLCESTWERGVAQKGA